MVRLHFVVEGRSEEQFVKSLLIPHLASHGVFAGVRLIRAKAYPKKLGRGGIPSYARLKKDLQKWMREDNNSDSFFTTMFDLYALPQDFPAWSEPEHGQPPQDRVQRLEAAFAKDVSDKRFVPYIQLHEFETLLLADPQKLIAISPGSERKIAEIERECSSFKSPEEIDEGPDTAPSKRIAKHLPDYPALKVIAASIVLPKIGLETLRLKCPHFNEWIESLERLAVGQDKR